MLIYMKQTKWWTLPKAAEHLGVHRATVNAMVLDGRLVAERHGSQWVIEDGVFQSFSSTYTRPHHSTKRHQPGRAADAWIVDILNLLLDWNDASAAELAEVLELHPGNVRKYLALAETRGLAERNDYGMWHASSEGRALIKQWRPGKATDAHQEGPTTRFRATS